MGDIRFIMIEWQKISDKIPKINFHVFILNKDSSNISIGKLQIYDKRICTLSDDATFNDGDIFWRVVNDDHESTSRYSWSEIDNYPLWMYEIDLINLTIKQKEKIEKEETDRFDILDI